LDLITIAIFTASWTAGMTAIMLIAIVPVVLLYNRLIIGITTGEKQKSISPS
jgi:hypothetical protein